MTLTANSLTTDEPILPAPFAISDLDPEQLIDSDPASEFLQVKPQTLNVWRLKGCGPAFYKIGRLVKYKVADLRAYRESRRCQNTAQADCLD